MADTVEDILRQEELLEEIVRAEEQARSERNFARIEAENRKLEENLLSVGETPAEPSKGFLVSLLDALDTGGQFVRGNIAKLTGHEDFADLGFIDAGIKGTRDDLTTGDLFRHNNILKESPITRGIASFAGDVLTDPLTFVTLGGGIGAKLGGRAVSKKALRTATGEALTPLQLFKRRESSEFLSEIAERIGMNVDEVSRALGTADDVAKKSSDDLLGSLQALTKGTLGADDIDDILGAAKSAASQKADAPFEKLAAALRKEKQGARAGKALSNLDEAVAGGIDTGAKSLREQAVKELNLADIKDLDDVFNNNAIRVANPLSGLFSFTGNAKIPILGAAKPTSRSLDLPLITPMSAKAFDALGGPAYNAAVKVADFAGKGVDALQASDNILLRFMGDSANLVRKAPRALSKRIALGGKEAKKAVLEHEIQNHVLRAQTAERLAPMFKAFDDIAGDNADEAYKRMQQAWEGSLSGINPRAGDINHVKSAYESVRQVVEELIPGAGDEGVNLWQQMQKMYADDGARHLERGTLSKLEENYVRRAYDFENVTGFGDIDDAERIAATKFAAMRKADGDFLSPLKPRSYKSMDEALRVDGLTPKFNAKEAFVERMVQSRLMDEEIEFMTRMGNEFALPRETYDKLLDVIGSRNAELREDAFSLLKAYGIDEAQAVRRMAGALSPEEIAAKVGKSLPESPANINFRDLAGEWLTSEKYQLLKNVGLAPQRYSAKTAIEASDNIAHLGLKFTPEEEILVSQMDDIFKQWRSGVLGRRGETAFTRSASTQLDSALKTKLLKSSKIDDETKAMLKGVLPRSMVHAIEDAVSNTTLWQSTAKSLKSSGVPHDVVDALSGLGQSLGGFLGAARYGVTLLWPAFWMRNLGSGQIMQTQSVATLGEALQPLRMISNMQMLSTGKGGVRTVAGEYLPARQLMREMRDFGVKNDDPYSIVDIMRGQKEVMEHFVPKTVKKYTGAGYLANKIEKLNRNIENYGREHLYMALRQGGSSPRSAAAETNQVMVDYLRGKTKVERDLLNNLFFFYTFTRQNTSNQIKSMLTRPGSLTTQLHAIEGVKEILMDPEAVPLPHELEEKLMGIRGKESVARFLRRSERGNPVLLQNIGVPVEDMSRLLGGIEVPRDMTAGAIFDAVQQSRTRTSQILLSQTNPLIKTIIEQTAGKNLFFNRPLSDKFLARVPKLASSMRDVTRLLEHPFDKVPDTVFRGIDSTVKTMLDGRDNGDGTIQVNPYRLAWLTMIVPALDRARFTLGATMDPNLSAAEKGMRLLSGIKVQEVEPEKSLMFDVVNQNRELARRLGVDTNTARERREMVEALLPQ